MPVSKPVQLYKSNQNHLFGSGVYHLKNTSNYYFLDIQVIVLPRGGWDS